MTVISVVTLCAHPARTVSDSQVCCLTHSVVTVPFVAKMCEVQPVNCATATGETPPEFAYLDPPQQCDEPMPPYKVTKPVYDGQFNERFPELDAVRLSQLLLHI